MARCCPPSALRVALVVLSSLSLGAQAPPEKLVPEARKEPPAKVEAKPKGTVKTPTDAKANMEAKAKTEAKARKAAAWKAKAADYAKRVDLNTAGKDRLKKVPGITDAIADQIIAGRPYLSKAHLVTRNIVPMSLYLTIKNQIKVESRSLPAAGPGTK